MGHSATVRLYKKLRKRSETPPPDLDRTVAKNSEKLEKNQKKNVF